MIRSLIVPLTLAIATFHAGQACAQGAFPAPLPNRAAAPGSDPAFPAVNGAAPVTSFGTGPASFPSGGAPPVGGFGAPAQPSMGGPGPSDACMKAFLPLREDAEKRGKLIKIASDRHAPPAEACKLIGSFSDAEVKMIKYVVTHSSECGIPQQVMEQLKTGHKNTEGILQRICGMAQQVQQQKPAGPSLSDVLGSSTALPEVTANKKGSTFDTLSGNALAR